MLQAADRAGRVSVTGLVDQSQRSALIALASANDRSLAAEIRRAIEAYLAHHVPAVK